ncbi:interferon-inducible protein AIM2-like isoform X1 [Chiloscyllium plagiosum]|uniref:interferon-inducible protein AIM2-like isoform X1 n=1 Tax=Chiloscyllium plagiosum TaxID=36176 RepID=UPI001CB7DD9D|nr:interferon-inducible protein AIM2-like isoform X1 [Chiloscyllium plagiosum]XP_043555885.1 interferon-inducible protein AIM2-like isoform X1 [Chiloscyllium plagiosum]
MASIQSTLLKVFEELSDEEYAKLLFFLEEIPEKIKIPRGNLKNKSKVELVQTVVGYYDKQAVKIVTEVLSELPRRDLLPIKVRCNKQEGTCKQTIGIKTRGPLKRKNAQDLQQMSSTKKGKTESKVKVVKGTKTSLRRLALLQQKSRAKNQNITPAVKKPGAQIITLKELKALQLNEKDVQKNLIAKGKIIEKLTHNYINAKKKKMKVFHATIADETDTIQVKVYNREQTEFCKGNNVHITDFRFSDGVMTVTKVSQITKLAKGMIKPLEDVPVLSVREIKQKPEGTFVSGCFKIIKVSNAPKKKDAFPLYITVADHSDKINVIIFNPSKTLTCETGKELKMMGVKVNVYKNEKQLLHQCDSYLKVL